MYVYKITFKTWASSSLSQNTSFVMGCISGTYKCIQIFFSHSSIIKWNSSWAMIDRSLSSRDSVIPMVIMNMYRKHSQIVFHLQIVHVINIRHVYMYIYVWPGFQGCGVYPGGTVLGRKRSIASDIEIPCFSQVITSCNRDAGTTELGVLATTLPSGSSGVWT